VVRLIWVLVGILFVAIAIGFYKFKLHHLLIGYNRKTKEEKEELNLQPLSAYYTTLSLFLALLFFTMAVLSFYQLQTVSTSISVIVVMVLIVGFTDSQRYTKMLTEEDAQPVRIAKHKYKQLIGYLCGAAIIVAIIIYSSLKPITIVVTNNMLEVTGSYGNTYPITAIENVVLTNNLPNIEATINGTQNRGQLQGLFQLEQAEQATLYITEDVNSYIKFNFNGETVYLNLDSIEETVALYEQLQ